MYFESDTVKSDCPVQIFLENYEICKLRFNTDCLVYFSCFTICSGDIFLKKNL